MLMMKKHVPVRLLKNKFFDELKILEDQGATIEEQIKLLGHGRARAGMLEGDIIQGELEIGQGCSMVKNSPTVAELVEQLVEEYQKTIANLASTL
jgi:enoyl-[acyl-carrier protein] reductase II